MGPFDGLFRIRSAQKCESVKLESGVRMEDDCAMETMFVRRFDYGGIFGLKKGCVGLVR